MLISNDPAQPAPRLALFNLGFRPFFLLAGVFSLISIFIWGGVYVYGWPAPRLPFSPMHWHAHEMIFGYGMAVVAGFLLTAVRNWTHLDTLKGYPLAGLAALWLAARMAGWVIPGQVLPMALLDLVFDLWFFVAILRPILRAKQHQQIGIASKIVLLMLANLCFYLGVSGVLEQGIVWGLYSGLYVLLALVFTMVRRVMPMFIERGVGYPVTLTEPGMDRSLRHLCVCAVRDRRCVLAECSGYRCTRRVAVRDSHDAAGGLALQGHLEQAAAVGVIRRLWRCHFGIPAQGACAVFILATFTRATRVCIGRHRHDHGGNDGAHRARSHRSRYSATLATACACFHLIVRGLRCPGAIADDRTNALSVVAGYGTGGMVGRLCIVCLGVCPHSGQTTRRREAGLVAARVMRS